MENAVKIDFDKIALELNLEDQNGQYAGYTPVQNIIIPKVLIKKMIGLTGNIIFHSSDSIASSNALNAQVLKTNLNFLQKMLLKILYTTLKQTSDRFERSFISAEAMTISSELIEYLPKLKYRLMLDAEAAYIGDPAAKSVNEIILCYPSIKALLHYRIAHKLHELGVLLIPRIITEMAHSVTGIDIHPGARIGDSFFMDHGTGIVIGETAIIGNNVKIYQGVTLGAKSFPIDSAGNIIKGIPRHPIIENNVTIYANATILGRITVGHDSTIGANMWVTRDVEPEAKLFNTQKTYDF